MKKSWRLLIAYIIIIFFYIFLGIWFGLNNEFSYPSRMSKFFKIPFHVAVLFLASLIPGLILTGIPAIIRKIITKKAYFGKSFLFSIVLFFDLFLFIGLISRGIINWDNNIVESLIVLSKFIFCLVLIPLQVIIFERAGFFYINFIRFIIEKIFSVNIVEKSAVSSGQNAKLTKETGKIGMMDNSIFKSIIALFNRYKKIVIPAVLGLIIAAALITGGIVGFKIFKNNRFAYIEDFSPSGFTNNKTAVRVLFSDEIRFADTEKPGEILIFNPKVSGIYEIRGRSLIFTPDADLKSSTKYNVKLNSRLLKPMHKLGIKSNNFEFYTEMMNVENTGFYFVKDEKNDEYSDLIGEIKFTLPVNIETLKERIEIKYNHDVINEYKLETSARLDTVYIKIKGIKHTDEVSKVKIKIKKGVMPITGSLGIQDDFTTSVKVKPKQRLEVESVENYPVKGNTFIAIKFNLPVKEVNLKKYISIEPGIPFDISSEYRYVILEADFEPNLDYKITINNNITSQNNRTMKEDYSHKITIYDMEPYVKFVSSGKILPKTSNLNVEFTSLNLDEVNFTVEKIYKNNLIQYLSGQSGYYDDYNSSRKYIHSKTFKITDGEINEEINNLINLKSLFNSRYEGMYVLRLRDPKGYYNHSTMTVNITDMGIIIKNDGKNLIVYILNILTLNPEPGVKVSLISRENQKIKEVFTDSEGKVVFYNYQDTVEKLLPYLIFAEKNKDFTYLMLDRNHLDYSTFNVSGQSYNKEYLKAFIKTERGVYRPGEDVYASIIVRHADLGNPDTIPLIITASDPAGKQVFHKTIQCDRSGVNSIKIPTSYQDKTGEYYIKVMRDKNNTIGSTIYKIEDFIPHKIEVKLSLLEQNNNSAKIKVSANELHGAPSKGLKVKTVVQFRSENFFHKDYKDYTFYDHEKDDFYQVVNELGQGKLDENGEISYDIIIPPDISPPSAIRALIYTEVFDSTGRAVSDAMSIKMHKYSTYFGVKVQENRPYKTGKDIKINYISIDSDGNLQEEDNVNIQVKRRVWYSIFKKYSWGRRYESEYYDELILEKKVRINGKGELILNPDIEGNYTVSVGRKGSMTTDFSFFVNSPDTLEYRNLSDPYKLIMNLDKKNYVIGETAYLTIISPFEGKAIVSIEREKVYKTMLIDLSTGKATVPVTVDDDFVPNMYVTAVAYRKPSYALEYLPPVSYGAVNISMDKSRLSQKIEVTTDKKIKSSDGLRVDVNIPGGAGSKVIIAAVDEGILQITNYTKPDAYDFFYRKKRLSVATNTTLKDLLPDIVPYKKAYGGGSDSSLERRHLNPIVAKRVKSISLYSGVLECGPDGSVSHTFKMDQFNGKLRVMVLSAKDKSFGSSERMVTVSDPIVIVPGIPRFLSPGDTAHVPVKIFNKTGKAGNFKLIVKTDGPVSIVGDKEKLINVPKDGQAGLNFELKGLDQAGVAHIRFDASGNNQSSFNEIEFAVRPSSQLFTFVKNGKINQNKTAEFSLNTDMIPQGKYTGLLVSSNELARCLSSLEYLIRYPYGCTEQTVSAAFPMLYLKELAGNTIFFGGESIRTGDLFLIDKYINAAVEKIEKRLKGDGEFVFWDNVNYGYPWISYYAIHFLIEAKRNGYSISNRAENIITKRLGLDKDALKKGRLDRRLDNLELKNAKDPYRLYLTALVGSPDFDNMRYYYDKLDEYDKKNNLDERSRCLLAAAYAISGDKEKASKFLPGDFIIKTAFRQFTNTLDSYARNTALYLYAVTLIDPDDKRVDALSKTLFEKLNKNGHFGNTHDTAWALFALSYLKNAKMNNLDIEIYIDNKLIKKINNTSEFLMKNNELDGKDFKIKNNDPSNPIFYNFTAFGYPLHPDTSEESNGFKVEKRYLTTDGKPIDIKSVQQGDQVVVNLTVTNLKKNSTIENLALVDLLPAGFEIINLRLESRGNFENIPENNIRIDYEDIRDDRIIIAAREIKEKINFSYSVRAVSPGKYIIPQFQAEAMYDPEINGRTIGGEELIILGDE